MELVVITQHQDLVERLRDAFETVGHRVHHLKDHLEALAGEAWDSANMILADASGTPMDGVRFFSLLRGESRHLFQDLPLFLIFDHPPSETEQTFLEDMDIDGWILAKDDVSHILQRLDPLIEGAPVRPGKDAISLLAVNLTGPVAGKIGQALKPYGYNLHTCKSQDLELVQRQLRAPIVFIGLDSTGHDALASITSLRSMDTLAFPILLGSITKLAIQRKLLLSGALDWVTPPSSTPRLLHACRRGLEWLHAKRLQQEFSLHLGKLREHRVMLEQETETLRSEVLADPLTDLMNRRAFTQHLDHLLEQHLRHNRPFTLILSDLDYFKLINDRLGHTAGDQVLKAISAILSQNLRKSDLAFRIGGEEFAILLDETVLKAGRDVAEKLRKRIDETPITLDNGQVVFPTMSFGVGSPTASLQEHPEGKRSEHFFMRVDQALYKAKQKGRNKVEITDAM